MHRHAGAQRSLAAGERKFASFFSRFRAANARSPVAVATKLPEHAVGRVLAQRAAPCERCARGVFCGERSWLRPVRNLSTPCFLINLSSTNTICRVRHASMRMPALAHLRRCRNRSWIQSPKGRRPLPIPCWGTTGTCLHLSSRPRAPTAGPGGKAVLLLRGQGHRGGQRRQAAAGGGQRQQAVAAGPPPGMCDISYGTS